MALTGLDPLRHTPGSAREIILGAGVSVTPGTTRDVLLFGNKTSAGSETPDTIGTQVIDDNDVINRFGRRSEARWLYRMYTAVDSGANIYICAPTESVGTAATLTITFATTATDTTTCTITGVGDSTSFTVSNGDLVTTIAANCTTAINAAAEGSWPFTAVNSGGGVVTVTAANLGPRGNFCLMGIRATFAKNVSTTAVVSAITAGTTEDSFTNAYAAMTSGTYFYQVSPKHTPKGGVVAPTPSDHGIGEHIANLQTMNLPVNGKAQCAFFGMVDTQANSTTVASSTNANSTLAYFLHQKNSDWTPGMLAAHFAAVCRSQQILHPSANIAGYRNTDNTVFRVPDNAVITDRLSTAEIEADLRNGISPVGSTSRGATYIVRQITSRSLNAQGSSDYRASEGHIESAIAFAWETFSARLSSTKQPFVDNDPPAGQKPVIRTTTPSAVKAIAFQMIDDLTSSNPLGLYEGPILAPSKNAQMKASVAAVKRPAGIAVSMDLQAVEHMLFTESTIREVGAAY